MNPPRKKYLDDIRRKRMVSNVNMKQEIITNGNRAVVINTQEGSVWANLYVNARDGIQNADITLQRWSGKTIAGAKKWAAKQLT